jgi:hypothetical protein
MSTCDTLAFYFGGFFVDLHCIVLEWSRQSMWRRHLPFRVAASIDTYNLKAKDLAVASASRLHLCVKERSTSVAMPGHIQD